MQCCPLSTPVTKVKLRTELSFYTLQECTNALSTTRSIYPKLTWLQNLLFCQCIWHIDMLIPFQNCLQQPMTPIWAKAPCFGVDWREISSNRHPQVRTSTLASKAPNFLHAISAIFENAPHCALNPQISAQCDQMSHNPTPYLTKCQVYLRTTTPHDTRTTEGVIETEIPRRRMFPHARWCSHKWK